jgi:hypothetical protein
MLSTGDNNNKKWRNFKERNTITKIHYVNKGLRIFFST